MSLVVGFGSVLVTDFFGILWTQKIIPMRLMSRIAHHVEKLIWLGWFGLVGSGIGLITLKGYVDNLTVIKLFFVVMIAANGLFLHSIKKISDQIGERLLPGFLKFRIVLASAVSQIGWWGALTIGFLHRHWKHNISWPENPALYIVVITTSILFIAIVGELFFQKNLKSTRHHINKNTPD